MLSQAALPSLAQQTQERFKKVAPALPKSLLTGPTPLATEKMSNSFLHTKPTTSAHSAANTIHVKWTLEIPKSEKNHLKLPAGCVSIERRHH